MSCDREIKDTKERFRFIDEMSSTFTHAVGGYLGAAAVALLVMFAVQSGEQLPWKIVSGSIFAASIILVYTASTAYHAVLNPKIKSVLRVCDQMAIYVLIAGTYTPLCLVTLRERYPILSWTVFGFVWGLTLAGILFKLLATRKLKYVTTVTYLAMGWFGLFLLKPLYDTFPFAGIVWIVLGGALYSLGVIFYLWRSMPLHHTIWHLFVLAGTSAHFFCILFYVMM